MLCPPNELGLGLGTPAIQPGVLVHGRGPIFSVHGVIKIRRYSKV